MGAPTVKITPKPTAPVTTKPTESCGRYGKGKLQSIGKKKLGSGKLGKDADICACKDYCKNESPAFTYFDYKAPKTKTKKGKTRTKPGKCTCYNGAEVSKFKASKKTSTGAGGSALESYCEKKKC